MSFTLDFQNLVAILLMIGLSLSTVSSRPREEKQVYNKLIYKLWNSICLYEIENIKT